jgi:flagellar biosynthesis protein FliR
MLIKIDLAPIIAVVLLSLRLGTLMIMTPIFPGLAKLVTIRVLFTFALSIMLIYSLPPESLAGSAQLSQLPLTLGALFTAAVLELVLGAVLAFGVFAAFGVFSLAGKIIDIQSGFGLSSVFDPVSGARSPIFSSMLTLLGVAVFFGLDGHHAFMRGIAFSVQQVPPGAGLSSLPLQAVTRQFGLMFSLALALMAPVMFALFLVEAGMALLSRVLPQMNVLVMGVAVKVVVALIVFALSLAVFLAPMSRIYATVFTYWEQVLF